MKNLEIIGTGSYVPEVIKKNQDFEGNQFYTHSGEFINQDTREIIEKFKDITGIEERRYSRPDQQTSDLGTIAARRALEDAGINGEDLDGIIVAHNFGNVPSGKVQSDILPSIATRVKHDLGIKNPYCIAFDILYGCPGWIQGVILAYNYIKAEQGKQYLIVGTESLSRKLDPYDRDSMIFSDGAGACVVSSREEERRKGILSTVSQTFTDEEAYYLYYDESNNPAYRDGTRYIKMKGRKIFEFSLMKVPAAMKRCLEKAEVDITDVKKVLIHQANEKMDEAIIKRLYKLYKKPQDPDVMPMSIRYLGNSSVATVPTLLDRLLKREQDHHFLEKGDVVLMASVGSGMSINAIAYQF